MNQFIKLIKKIFYYFKCHDAILRNFIYIKRKKQIWVDDFNLFTQKNFEFTFNRWFDSILFVFNFQESHLHSLFLKKNNQFGFIYNKRNFIYFVIKMMNFYNLIYKSIFILFSFKKNDLYKLFQKNINKKVNFYKIIYKSISILFFIYKK